MASEVMEAELAADIVENTQVDKGYVPILRYGQIVSATLSGQRFVFDYNQIDTSIDTLHDYKDEFETVLADYFANLGWTVDRENEHLSGFRVVRKLGAVTDFPEIAISKDGIRVVVRASVTVCVDKRGQIDEQPKAFEKFKNAGVYMVLNDDDFGLYSKIWIRSVCVDVNGKALEDQSVEEHLDFVSEFEGHSIELINRLSKPYKLVLAELINTKPNDLEIHIKESISNLTVSADHDSLRAMYEDIRHGEFVVDDCRSLSSTAYHDLFERFFGYINTNAKEGAGDVGCANLYPFKTRFTKGVYAVQVHNHMTRIFGAAHSPFWGPDELNDGDLLSTWKHSPGNALGAIAMTGIASRF